MHDTKWELKKKTFTLNRENIKQGIGTQVTFYLVFRIPKVKMAHTF